MGDWPLTSKGDLPEADIQAIERLIDHPALSDGRRASLHFGLAQVYDGYADSIRAPPFTSNRPMRSKEPRRPRSGMTYDADQHSGSSTG